MKRIQFNKILLLSKKENKARVISFNSGINIIYGDSMAGKSHIIQSLFATFGCSATAIHDSWFDEIDTLVKFSIDDTSYEILRKGKLYAIYQEEKLVKITEHVSSDIGGFLTQKLGLNITLIHKQTSSSHPPHPTFFFLPFYLDQERGWLETWASFKNISYFLDFRKTMLMYHTGIWPDIYFQKKQELKAKETLSAKLFTEIKTKEDALQKINQKFKDYNFNIDVASFKTELEELLRLCNNLQNKESNLKIKITSKNSEKIRLLQQIQSLDASIKEINKDLSFLSHIGPESLQCPVCGTKHLNSFTNKLSIANDLELLSQLQKETQTRYIELSNAIHKDMQSLEENNKELQRIQELLGTTRNNVKLETLLQNKSQTAFQNEMQLDIDKEKTQWGQILSDIELLKKALRETTPDKSEIIHFFKNQFNNFCIQLDVSQKGKFKDEIDYTIQAGGNQKIRLILSYFYAILKTIEKFSTAIMAPIVIDEPKQQGPSEKFYADELIFIIENLPKQAQLILSVNDLGPLAELSDTRRTLISIKGKEHLLVPEEYNQVQTIMTPFLKQFHERFIKTSENNFFDSLP